MATDLIRYDLMVQEALRGVVRRVLNDVARYGLPGEHHLYVSFRTTHGGVRLSNRLREQYPEEMTVVLQHQFWDLKVHEDGFEVVLSFKGVSEQLVVPYEAIVGFFDPSVQFGLKFEAEDRAQAAPAGETPAPRAETPARAKSPAKIDAAPEPARPEAAKAVADIPAEGPKVVSLDSFRKKP